MSVFRPVHLGDALVEFGLGGGYELHLGVEVALALVELAAAVGEALQHLQLRRREPGLFGELGRGRRADSAAGGLDTAVGADAGSDGWNGRLRA